MDLDIDSRDALPIYAQIVDQVRQLVGRGALARGERLPSVRDLAVRLRVNRNTVAKAYAHLEGDGVLETRKGEGTFVAAAPRWSQQRSRHELQPAVDRLVAEAARLGVSGQDLIELVRERAEHTTVGGMR